MLTTIIQCIAAIAIFMTCMFLISVKKHDNTVADVAWGAGFIIIALCTFFRQPIHHARHIVVTTLIILWGIRLGTYLYIRNKNKGEDPRYKAWRQQWGAKALLYSFVYVFMLQGLVMLIIAYPIILVNNSSIAGLTILDYLGIAVWIFGFAFESISDFQLYSFLQKPENKGRVLQQGLWKYSRHPNYFGESCMWWGIFLIALNVPWGITAIISPLLITYLLLYVSGIPLLEKPLEQNPEYKEYQRKTNAFIPWSQGK